MAGGPVEWFTGKSLGVQVLVLAAAFDPLGAAAGFLLAPQFGVEPPIGAGYGLLAGTVPTWAWAVHVARQ